MKINNHEVTVITRCPICGHANEVEVNDADYWDWQDGELVQNAFPYLSADEREMLISGICPTCWNGMFDEEDEKEDYEDDFAWHEATDEEFENLYGGYLGNDEIVKLFVDEDEDDDFDWGAMNYDALDCDEDWYSEDPLIADEDKEVAPLYGKFELPY